MAMFGFGALGVARAHAAGASSVKAVAQAISKNIYGWDSVGRVPYDDYLFSTWALTDPNLLKRTIIEEVVSEIPDVMANFRRNKVVHDVAMYSKGMAGVMVCVTLFGIVINKSLENSRNDRKREAELFGRAVPLSATYRNGGNSGKQMEGEEGWVDMGGYGSENFYDDDDDTDKKDKKDKKKKK